MPTQSFILCRTCGQRKDYTLFGLNNSRCGRQHNCHDCVLELLKKSGTVDNYTAGKSRFHERNRKGAFQDYLYYRKKNAIKHKNINSARAEFYKNKKSENIRKFKEMFPVSN